MPKFLFIFRLTVATFHFSKNASNINFYIKNNLRSDYIISLNKLYVYTKYTVINLM